eukprot:3664911-Pleurochrysis_carterae.AAC.1
MALKMEDLDNKLINLTEAVNTMQLGPAEPRGSQRPANSKLMFEVDNHFKTFVNLALHVLGLSDVCMYGVVGSLCTADHDGSVVCILELLIPTQIEST